MADSAASTGIKDLRGPYIYMTRKAKGMREEKEEKKGGGRKNMEQRRRKMNSI